MKKLGGLVLGIILSATIVVANNGKGEKVAFEVDTNSSKVYWTGSKITGSYHTGYLSIENGTVTVENNKVTGGTVNMDLNSIVCTDLENEDSNKKLVGHLKSDDFFSVEKYPEAQFEIVNIKAANGNKYEVQGNLTMKGATHEITFPANISVVDGKVTADGTASIDRTKWDIKYGSGSFFKGLGDNMIKDEFEIRFELKTIGNANTVSVN